MEHFDSSGEAEGLYVRLGSAPETTKAAPVIGTEVPDGMEWSERYTVSA
jgi:hypothetical protein